MAQITLNSTGVASDGALVLQSNGTTSAVTISTAQNVGIGGASAGEKLEVVGSIQASGGASSFNRSGLILDYQTGSSTGRIAAGPSAGGTLAFYTGNGATVPERMRITDAGQLLVGVTSANANGGVLQLKSGITFPATQVAATDVNTLDDYEEGTWTPVQGAGLTVVGAFSSSGQYTKIGKSVTVFGLIAGATSVACTANGQLCTGLPFTPNTEFQGSLINGARSFSNNVGALGSGAVQNSTILAATSSASFTITYFV